MNRRIWLIIVCIFAISPSFGQSLPSYVPTNGLVGWWPFDGNANDISGNGNHGSAVGASLTADRHGLPNNAYDFDGLNDYILVSGSGIPVDGKTYSVWVNADVLTNNSRSIIEHGAPSSSRWALRVMNNQIESAYGIGCSGNTTAAQSTNDMTANDWKHIAVRDNGGNTLEIFLNGTLVSTQSVNNQGTNCSTAGLYFGVDIFGAAEFFNGKLDDIGVWNRSLTNEEIAQLYSSTIQCSDITINHSDTTICYGDTVSLYADYFDDANYTYIGSSNTSDYYIDNTSTGWTNSRNAALAAGADLVVIEDATEQQLLDSIVYAASLNISGYKGFHIGYYQDLQSSNYSEPNGGWTWVNGSSTFTNWAASEPNNSGPCQAEHWAMMYDNGSWNDECDGIWDGNDLRGIIEVPKNKALSNFAWSTGSSNSSIDIYPTQETTYWITSVENGSTCRDTITVKVNDARVSYSTLQLCENENDSALLYLSTPSIDTYTPLDSISQAITSNWSKQMTTVPGEQYILEVGGLFTYGTYCPNLVNDPAYQLAGYYGLTSPNPRNIGSSVGGLYVLGQAIGRPSPDVYNGTTHTYTYPFTASGNSITVGWYDAGPSDNCGTISFRLLKVNQNAIWSTGKVSDSLWVNPSVTSSYWVAKTENGTTCTTSTSIEILTSSILNQDTTICAGETMIIKTIDGKVGVWSTGQTASQITVTPTQNATYWVAPYANGVICYDTINVTVNPIPAAPTWDPANITEYCKGDPSPVELTATTLSGHTVNWYGPSGALLTTSAARTPSTNISGNTIYRVTQTNSFGCESPALIIMVTVHDLPTAPITSNSTIQYCQNETATGLTAIASSGHTLVWYDSDGTTVLVSAPIPSTSNVGTTTYYVAQKNSATDCEGPKSSITVSVNITPSPPTATTTYNYCPGDVASALSATASVGHTLIWYNSNGSIITSGAPTPYTGTVGTTNYFVSQQNSLGCESVAQIITVNVDPTPIAPTVSTTSFTYCKGDIATALTATPSSGHTLVWYDSDASTVLTSAVVPQTTTPGTITYYVAQENANGCESPLVSITVTVNPLPSAPLASATVSYCINDVATTLTATPSSGHTLVWYNTNGTTVLSGAPTPYTAFAGTTTYYVSQVNANGCEGPLTPITVTVHSSPSTPITNTTVDYCQGATASVLSATITSGSNNTLVWYDSDASTVLSSAPTPQTVVSGSKTYYVAQQNSIGCESPLQAITVSVNPIPATPTVNPSNVTLYCLNDPSPSELVAIASIGHTLTWYDASNNILSTSLLRTPSTGLAGTTTYRVTQSNNSGCESAALNIDVTVNPLPTITVVEGLNQYTCIGSPISLTGTGAGTNGTYSWSGGIVNGASFTPTNNASYTLTGTDQNGCSASATANITLAPGSIENNDTTLCYGESLTLECINNQVGIWSTGDTASQITVSPTQNTTYWVAPFTNGVNCSDTVTISVINSNIITADSLFCESPDSVLLHTTVANLSTTESIPYGLINANGIYVSNNGSDVNGTGTQSNPYKTIQKGINESSSNGSVIVLPGTYKGVGNVNLSLLGKNIVLQSMTGPDNTIIDGENLSPGFILNSAETISTIIRGFTLQNCVTTSKTGSAIFVEDNSGITVRSCIFKSNSLLNTTNGSVIQLGDNETSGPSSQVDSCIFYNNTMAVLGSSKKSWRMSFCLIQGNTNTGNLIGNGHDAGNDQEIEYCVFRNNTTTSGPIVSLGHAKTLRESFFINNTTNSVGAVYLGTVWSGTNIVDHCTFYNHDGTVYSSNWYDHIGNVTNCIFYGSTGLETISGNQNSITFTYSNGNLPLGTGNTSGNPLFSNPSNNDFTLSPNSPCIGTGSNSSNQGADPSNIPEWLWTFTASSNSLLWSIGDSNDSIWTKPTQTTQYWVEQSQNGTTCSDSITISVNQGIQASDTTICYGENVTLSTVSGQSAIWSTGDTASSITVNPATTTKYWATTSYIGGTCSDTLTVFVNAPKINSNDLYLCAPQDSVLLYNSNHLNSACSPLVGSLALNSNGWYPFCGNSDDLSPNQNVAFVDGAILTNGRSGGTNSAYYFDGVDDYLMIFDGASNNYGTSSISMAAWVKMPTVSNPQQAPIIGNYISTTTAAFNLMVGGANELNPGKLNFFARNSSGAEMNLWSTTRIDDDQWHHVAIVRNSTNDSAFLYIDGTLNRKSAIASGSFDSFQGFVIGGAHLNRYLKCTIDEIATWRRALSSSEIHQLATQAPSISNWSTGQSTDSIWVKPTQTTTYWIEQSLNGVTCLDSATVFINKVNIEPSLPTICTPGDSVLLYAPGVEQGFDEPNCNSGYVGLRPTYTPGESINGYSYKGMYNGHHYYLANSPGSWTDAAAAAKIAGGHLVCIDDVNEQNFVANLSTGNLWLGYYRTPTNAWAWVNCQTSNYTNWRSGEPGTSEPYAHIITDNCSYNGGANQWNDIGNLSNNGVCYSNCYGVLEIDPDEIGFGQNSQVLSWSNGANNDSIWLTPNQDGDYWLTSYVNGEGCSDTVSLRVLNPAITAPTTTSCSPGDSVMLYYSGNREFAGLDTIAVPDQLIGQVTKPMTALWTQSWNVTPNQTYIMKVSGLYDVCCGSQGCLDAAFLTLNCYSQSQQSASNPCSSGGWWIFNDDCGIRPDNDVYNPSHEYYYTFENTDGTIDLSFSDNVGDNSGSLTFTLYSTKQKVVRTYNDTITWSTGETSDTIWVTPTTTSTYSVTASRGGVICLDSVQIDVTTLSNFDPLNPIRIHCEATNTVLDGTDGSAISYNWSNGAQTSSTTVIASGQYWVQATDNLGCSFSDTTQVWLSDIQSNLSSIEPTCYGFSNGSITPNASGGISSYSYQWSNGDTTAALSATASGLYWVTITDSVGCSVQDSILLDEPADLTVTASATSNYNGYNIPCFGGSNGQANTVVSGGTLPYTYSWSNGSPDSIVYSLAAGTHTVNIMDSNGCITSDTVLITQPTGINTSLSSTSSYNGFDISCYGVQDGSIQLAVSGGVTPYQHYWSNGANGTSVSNIGAGLYTVNTVDANGCSSVDSITLNQPNVLTSTATIVSNYNGYNVSCYGASDGSAQISALGGNAPYTYSWSNGTTSNQNSGISAGSYSVTVMDTNGCTVQNSVVLNEPTELQISTNVTSNFNGYPISCTGANDGSAMVNGNGGTAPYTILWSNGDTSLTTNNLSAGTYFVTVTDANGCSKSDSVVLSDPIGLSNLTLSASSYNGFNISCHGGNDGTISMTGVNGGTAPLSYYWNTGDSTSSITGLPVGNYTLTVTDVNGCSISDSLTLNQPTVLTSNASVTSNFNGTNISCNGATDGSAQVSGAGGVGPYIFLWNTSDTSTTIANLSAGTYTVLVTDANGCSTTDTVSLTEPSLFSITAGVQSNYNGYNISCAGGANGQVAALAIGGTGPYNYNWSNGSSSPGQNNLAAGTYIINVSDANGCSAADTLTLIEPSSLSSIASVTSNYNGYNVSCQGAQDGSATVNAQGGVTPYSINWSNGASGATVSNLGAGVHTVNIQDANGCSTNASVNLTEPGGVSVTATSSPTTCYGADDGSATLTVSGGTGNFDIQWSNGGTGLNQTGLASNWYSYTISTSPNCFLTDSIWVDQPEPLVIQVDTVPPTCISAFDGEINVVAFGGTPGYQYFLNGTAFSGFQDELGTDSLEIVAVDMNNCDTTLILAMPAQTQSCLFIPNWFTPNGNNQEDAWRIEGFEYENLRLKVFNVMGQLIYTTESSTYIPWDGNYNGSPLPEGDYYYLIESTVNDSKYSGYVTLLR